MTQIVSLFDRSVRAVACDKITAGGGAAALSFEEWLAINHVDDPGWRREEFIVETALEMGMKRAELLAAVPRVIVYVEGKVRAPHYIEINGYLIEIQDAPAPAP